MPQAYTTPDDAELIPVVRQPSAADTLLVLRADIPDRSYSPDYPSSVSGHFQKMLLLALLCFEGSAVNHSTIASLLGCSYDHVALGTRVLEKYGMASRKWLPGRRSVYTVRRDALEVLELFPIALMAPTEEPVDPDAAIVSTRSLNWQSITEMVDHLSVQEQLGIAESYCDRAVELLKENGLKVHLTREVFPVDSGVSTGYFQIDGVRLPVDLGDAPRLMTIKILKRAKAETLAPFRF